MEPFTADPRVVALFHLLASHRPRLADAAPDPGGAPLPLASVALVVRPQPADLELLLIKRATAAGDPWSGHMALPGGRRAAEDADALATAIREAREEVGVDLEARGALLGRLDDLLPRDGAPRIVVSPFVFVVPPDTATRINYEVALAVWVPLGSLVAPGAATEHLHALASGEPRRFPAIGYQGHVIWGITHRILVQFLELARAGAMQGELT